MPRIKNNLCILLPNVLLPDSLFMRYSAKELSNRFSILPQQLLRSLASQSVQFTSAKDTEPAEAYLYRYFAQESDCNTQAQSVPAWAMLYDDSVSSIIPTDFSRWWLSVGSLSITSHGAEFLLSSELSSSASDLEEFWQLALPILTAAGWRCLQKASSAQELTEHAWFEASHPVPMQQVSPWSLQHVQLTDWLPKSQACSAWRKLWFNLQTQFNQAPFNQRRQAKGLQPLNCLWFWGGGQAVSLQRQLPQLNWINNMTTSKMSKLVQVLSRLVATVIAPSAQQEVSLTESNPLQSHDVMWFAGTDTENDDFTLQALIFTQLSQQVAMPMWAAGVRFEWVLFGPSGWLTVPVNWQSRLKFWKKKPNWLVLKEPVTNNEDKL